MDFYCHEARLAVELDGGQHAEEDQLQRDNARSASLHDQGVQVLRFWNSDVLRNPVGVLESIAEALEGPLEPSPQPSPRGRGRVDGRH